MSIVKNLAKGERAVRIILGGILIVGGLFLAGWWKPLSILIGVCLVASAFAGY